MQLYLHVIRWVYDYLQISKQLLNFKLATYHDKKYPIPPPLILLSAELTKLLLIVVGATVSQVYTYILHKKWSSKSKYKCDKFMGTQNSARPWKLLGHLIGWHLILISWLPRNYHSNNIVIGVLTKKITFASEFIGEFLNLKRNR